ncbi:MAG: exodeoxyribonuclease VII small subunit [Deltaproteobacteria bacterium]|nr:exodeoxyribonuclease VII small subunit [Deltaproteobacteria bacterium]
MKFEEGIKRLEEIVEKLEKGDLLLEDSLKLFEEGIKLTRLLNQKLNETEKKVEMLIKDENGNIKTVPFDDKKE